MTDVIVFLHDVIAVTKVPSYASSFALVGASGSGKTYCLGQLCETLAADGYSMSSIGECLRYGDTDNEVHMRAEEKRVIVAEYFSLVADLEASPSPLGYGELTFAPHTVLMIDQIELLDALCQINGKTHLLQRLARTFFDSKSCTLVMAAEDENNIPFYWTESHSPRIFKLAAFSGTDMLQLRNRLSAESTGRESGKEEEPVSSSPQVDLKSCKRSMVAAVSLCLGTTRSCNTESETKGRDELSDALASFADGKGDVTGATDRIHLYGLQPLAERLRILVQVFVNLRQQTDAQQRLVSKSVSTTGILLHGPSGCGKTALVQQLALDFPKVHFSFVNCTTLFSKYLGESEEKLRAVYQAARAKAPSVVVLDEVDVIAPSRGSLNEANGGKTGVDVSSRMLAGLLCELDGVTDNSGVLTICTTNAPHVIDVALLRQGRLETILYVPPLTAETAREMTYDFFAHYGDDTNAADVKNRVTLHLSEKMKHCTPASLKYMLRKILENQLRAIGKATASHGENFLQFPTAMEIDALVKEHSEIINPVHYSSAF